MTKKELEKEINDLKVKIAALEARQQIFCAGHYCNCHHSNIPNPIYPYYGPTWVSTPTTTICGTGTLSTGSTEILNRTTN